MTGAGNILVDAAPGAGGYIQLAVSNTAYTGNITIRSGLVRAASFNAALGSGTVYLGDSTTPGDALLQYTTNDTFTTPVVVAAGSGARAIIGPSSGTNVTIAGPITLNNDLRLLVAYTSTRNAFLSSAFSGDHTITVSRMTSTAFGGFNISGNSSGFTGTWRVEGDAKLYLGAATAIGAAEVDVILNGGTLAYVNGGTLDLGSTRNVTLTTAGGSFQSGEAFTSSGGGFEVGTGLRIGGVVSGNGGLLKTGAGTLTLSNAANTYSGGTTIAAGTLIARSLGTGPVTLSDATSLISLGSMTISNLSLAGTGTINSAAGTVVLSGAVAGGGNLNLIGGTLTLSGDGSSYTGQINLTNGTLQIGGGGATGSISATSIINNGAVVFNRSNAYSFNSPISGTGSVSVTGGGALTLAGNNVYTGSTLLQAGSLNVAGTLGNTTVAVSSGATLLGSGTIGGVVTSSGSINPGSIGGAGTLKLADLILSGGSLNFDLGTNTLNGSDRLVLNGGAFNVTAATSFNFNDLGTFGLGTYDLITGYAGAIGNLNLLSVPVLFSNYSLTLADNSGVLQLLVTSSAGSGPQDLTWSGGSGTWGSNNYAGGATYADGDDVTFNNSPGTSTVTIAGSVAPGEVIVNNNSGNTYVFSGGPITGTASLTKNGAGTLELANNNTYSGGTAVNGGRLVVSGAITGNVQVNNSATLVANGDVRSLVTVENGGSLQGNGSVGAIVVNAGGTIGAGNSVGALTIDGNDVAGGPSLTLNTGANLIFEFNDVDAGPGIGWDYIELGGGLLTINASNLGLNQKINLHINSLDLANIHGAADGFNAAPGTAGNIQEYYWKFIGVNDLNQIIATGPSSIGGRFNVIDDALNAGVFDIAEGNPFNRPYSTIGQGTFRVLAGDFGQGNGLYVMYSAVPEPGSMLLAGIGSLSAALYGRRRRKRQLEKSIAA